MKLSEAFAKRTYDNSPKPGSPEDIGKGEVLLAQGLAALAIKELEDTPQYDYHDVWLLANESYLSDSLGIIREHLDEILKAHFKRGQYRE